MVARAFTGIARPGVRLVEISVPGRVGLDERAHVQRDPAAVEGDEGARVQDLGAEVGHLGRLAVVELRHEARVGHRLRIGGEDAGHVLPQHHALGPEDAGRGWWRSGRSRRGPGW